MSHPMKMIWPFLSLIVKTLDGKLMFASFKSTTWTMELTVTLKCLPKLTHMSKLRMIRKLFKTRQKKLNRNLETTHLNSKRHLKKCRVGLRNTKLLMTFLIVNFLSHMILQISMALTSPVPFVIKVLVDPAILYPLLKSLNQDLG